MALADYLKTDFVIMDRISVPDPMGGVQYVYQQGAEFKAGVVADHSTEMQLAGQTGAKALYTLVVDKKIVLERDQIIRRADDGANFRLTTDTRDMTTPAKAMNQFSQASMERVVL